MLFLISREFLGHNSATRIFPETRSGVKNEELLETSFKTIFTTIKWQIEKFWKIVKHLHLVHCNPNIRHIWTVMDKPHAQYQKI